jgi:hypothetical protein
MAKQELTETITFRATPRDVRRLARLMRHFDRTASNTLRRLIAEENMRLADVLKVTRKDSDHGSEEGK